MAKVFGKWGTCLLFLFMLSFPAEAQDVIKVAVTGDDVNIRSAPNSKGKILAQAFNGQEFLVDSAPVQDTSDKSTW